MQHEESMKKQGLELFAFENCKRRIRDVTQRKWTTKSTASNLVEMSASLQKNSWLNFLTNGATGTCPRL